MKVGRSDSGAAAVIEAAIPARTDAPQTDR